MEGLEQVPARVTEFNGKNYRALDVDAIIARHPQLVLVDELQHTNPPGSTQSQTWQDVELLLQAGINVLSTLDVQHLESLNDQVYDITGVRVIDTVPDRTNEEPVLQVQSISGDGFKNISFDVYKGEVVGLAGLVGAGRTEIAEAIYGMNKVKSGKVYLNGKDITDLSVNETIESGLAYIPEDRFLNGIFSISSLSSNITAQIIKKHRFFIDKKFEKKVTDEYVRKLRIKMNSQDDELNHYLAEISKRQ